MAFKGITFGAHVIPALETARAYESVFPDGILYGCEMSYSGKVLTIAPGTLITEGRIVTNDAAVNLTISGTSGYRRVILTIDATKTGSKSSTFTFSTRTDSATKLANFSALTKEDINDGTHTTYEVMLAILSMGSGGITGIVDQMPSARCVIHVGTEEPTVDTLPVGDIYLQFEE